MNGYAFIVRKELTHLVRDPVSLVIAFLMPLVQLTIFGFAVNFDVRHIETVVVDFDHSREAREFVARLQATDYLAVVGSADSPDQAAEMLRSNQAKVAVTIPPNFARTVAAGGNPEVGVLIDGSDGQVATRARMAFFAGGAKPPPGTPIAKTDVLFNPNMRSETFMIPGLIGVILQIVTLALTSFSMVREREQGTLEQLMVSPVGKLGLMLGKITPYAALAFGEVITVLVAGYMVFDVRVAGSLALLLALSIPFILAVLSMGLLISTIAQNQAQAMQLTVMLTMPAILISGFMFPRSNMPGFLYIISEAFPVTHFLEVLRGIVVRGAGFGDIWPSAAALMLISVVLIGVSTLRFRKSFA